MPFQDRIIEEVVDRGDYDVKVDGSFRLWVPRVAGLPAPQVGDRLRTYGRMGHAVLGIAINGRIYLDHLNPPAGISIPATR